MVCERCGATIFLIKVGVADNHKWVTNPDKPLQSWNCRPTPEFPVRSHTPLERNEAA